MVGNHWLGLRTGKLFVPNLEQFGFVYIITNLKTNKKYIGCKQYFIGKSKRESRWQSYMGSSKYLKEDIKKLGKKHFKFEVIDEFKNKRSLKYYELVYQVQHNVLTSCVEGSDNHKYYNNYIGGKFFRPVERKEVQNVSKGSNVQHSTS